MESWIQAVDSGLVSDLIALGSHVEQQYPHADQEQRVLLAEQHGGKRKYDNGEEQSVDLSRRPIFAEMTGERSYHGAGDRQ